MGSFAVWQKVVWNKQFVGSRMAKFKAGVNQMRMKREAELENKRAEGKRAAETSTEAPVLPSWKEQLPLVSSQGEGWQSIIFTAPVTILDFNFSPERWEAYLLLVVVIQSLSRVWLFVTPWTAAHEAPLSSTISQSLVTFVSIESVLLSNHSILCCPSPFARLCLKWAEVSRTHCLPSFWWRGGGKI